MKYPGAVHHVTGAYDSSGDFFPLDSMAQTITRDVNDNITQVVATNGSDKWTQTFTYSNGKLTTVSQWIHA